MQFGPISVESDTITLQVGIFTALALAALLLVVGKVASNASDWFINAKAVPFIKDLWAKRTKASAERKAESLLGDYKRELEAASDVRHLLLTIEGRLSVDAALSATVTGAALLLAVLWGQETSGEFRTLSFVVIAVFLYTLLVFQVAIAHKRRERLMGYVREPEVRREEIVERLTLLLKRKLSEGELKEWLRKVPAAAPKPTAPERVEAKVPAPRLATPPAKPADKKTVTAYNDPTLQVNPLAVDLSRRLHPNRSPDDSVTSIGRTQTEPLLGRTDVLLNPIAFPKKEKG